MRSFKYLTVLLLIILVKTGMAQRHDRVYNIYTQNRFVFNPAHTADFGQAFLNVREQWLGLSKGPEDITLGVHSAIGNAKTSGLGLLASREKRGLYNFINVNANYAYIARLNDANSLSFGLGLGILDNRINYADAIAADKSEIQTEGKEKTRMDARIGLKYNWNKKLEVGFSMPSMLTDDYGFNQFFTGMASYKLYAVREKLEIEPSVFYKNKKTDYSTSQLDFNLYTCWNQTFWLSGTYRMNPSYDVNSMNIAGGVYFYNVGIGYSYQNDFGGGISTFSNGTHEFHVSYYFDKDRKKKNNEDLLNNNQLEQLCDSAEQDDEFYQRQIDSLRNMIDDLNNAMKLKDVSEFADAVLDKLRKYDQQVTDNMKELDDRVVVFFDTNKYNVKPEYTAKLDDFADLLKNTNAKVVLHGYADETGPAGYNKTLSEKRAEAVRDYLVRQGVKRSNLTIEANGETSQFGGSLQQNRRVEVMK